MNNKQFSLLVAALVLGFVVVAFAQSYGALAFGTIAPTLANCPAGSSGSATLCAVGSSGTYAMYVSYNAGTYQLLVPAGQNGVSSFNGRTGNVTLTKSDVTSTGLGVSTSVTATSTLQ